MRSVQKSSYNFMKEKMNEIYIKRRRKKRKKGRKKERKKERRKERMKGR